MKRTKEEAALTRQAVLDAALTVFSRKGFAHTTLQEIAKEAGMTRGAIYWHFSNKYEVFRAVLDRSYEFWEAKVQAIIDSGEPPIEKLRNLMLTVFLFISNEDEYRVSEEIEFFRYEKKEEGRQLYEEHLEEVKEMRTLIKGLVVDGIASGDLNAQLDPDVTTWAIISYLSGMKSSWLSGLDDNISIPANSEKLADIFLKGISSR